MTRLVGALLVIGSALTATSCRVASEVRSGQEGVSQASQAACHEERLNMERAVETYDLMVGSMPTSELAMVPDYLLVESRLMDIDAQGNVIPAPGTGC